MKSRIKKPVVVLNVFVIVLALALVFGPLLPWSPFKPGYQLTRRANADVFFHSSSEQLGDYSGIDGMMREAEKIEAAVLEAVRQKRTTQDIGGTLGTREAAEWVVNSVAAP